LEVAVKKDFEQRFGNDAAVPRWDLWTALKNAAKPVLSHAYEHFVPAKPGQTPENTLAGALLVIGRDAVGYWLLELDHLNNATFYTDQHFHAVGSGGSAAYVAQGVMKAYDLADRSMPHLRLAAFRTVSTCIEVLGGPYGVGGNVSLWFSEGGAAFEKAPADVVEQLKDGLAQLGLLEAECLDKVVLPEDSPEEREAEAEVEAAAGLPEDLAPGD
jgi:hypothetical protein